MHHRNRAEGWQHAKITGHSNEELCAFLLKENLEVQKRFLNCLGLKNEKVEEVKTGALHEHDVPSILGDKTKAKPDLYVTLSSGNIIGVSLKKSLSGQVFLISVDRFIQGFEAAYDEIPDIVKQGIKLFWGGHPDIIKIANKINGKYIDYELRKKRLVHDTIAKYNPDIDSSLINWFRDNVTKIFEFCFTKGLASEPKDWAHIIWYKNMVDPDVCVDTFLTLDTIRTKISTDKIVYGTRTGGSTILLPFGFVQWHDPGNKGNNNLQFHHKYNELIKLL
ncbi:MAG: hypothetical protein MR708_05645 [Bacteroidales bacterium]|nr:hypothetical protein [Bacteroidales bacterium]